MRAATSEFGTLLDSSTFGLLGCFFLFSRYAGRMLDRTSN